MPVRTSIYIYIVYTRYKYWKVFRVLWQYNNVEATQEKQQCIYLPEHKYVYVCVFGDNKNCNDERGDVVFYIHTITY